MYESFLSIVSIVDIYDREVESKIKALHDELNNKFADFEILLISNNQDTTPVHLESIDGLLDSTSCIRHIHLSGLVKRDVMYASGCELAVGDFVFLFNLESDPIDVITPMFLECKSGSDIVTGVTDQTKSVAYDITRACLGSLLKLIEYNLPKGATELRCISRRAINTITRTGRYHHQFYMRIHKSGYKSTDYRYKFCQTFSEHKNLPKMLRYLLSIIVFNSTRPLRWASSMGAIGSFLAFSYAIFSVISRLLNGDSTADGWTTIVLFLSSLFMVQFVILAFFGEYLARLLDDRSEQSDYSIIYEKNSYVMVNKDRVNVLDTSIAEFSNKVQTGRDR